MKLTEAIAAAKQNTGIMHISDDEMTRWLSALDGRIALEVFNTEDYSPYDATDNANSELLIPFPYDEAYPHYLAAKMFFTVGEYVRYQNEQSLSNKYEDDYRRYVQRTRVIPQQRVNCGWNPLDL